MTIQVDETLFDYKDGFFDERIKSVEENCVHFFDGNMIDLRHMQNHDPHAEVLVPLWALNAIINSLNNAEESCVDVDRTIDNINDYIDRELEEMEDEKDEK